MDLLQLQNELKQLQERLSALEDHREIERLEYIYGYYLDNRMWHEVADLFSEETPSIEIGRRGKYIGKERIQRFLHDVLGRGRWGLLKDEVVNHTQLQPVITLNATRDQAQVRARAIIQLSSPPGGHNMLWAEGVYENVFIKENGAWKIKEAVWVPTYYFEIVGTNPPSFQSAPEDNDFPPDAPSRPLDSELGRTFLTPHYVHPFSGKVTRSPSSSLGAYND